MRSIVIDVFKSVFTNADPEDIGKENFIRLRNLSIKKPGVIEKTFDYGDKFDYDVIDVIDNDATIWDDTQVWVDGKYWVDSTLDPVISTISGEPVTNIVSYSNRNLITPNGSGIGFALIAYIVNSVNYKVTIKYWNGSSWLDIDDLLINTFSTYYHKRLTMNPIIQASEIVRFLPGNVGLPNGSNEAKGIWIGWIDYDFFDEYYTAGNSDEVTAGTKDYQEGFYSYDCNIEKPDVSDLNITLTEMDDGDSTLDEELYFKFSYVYDGIQESLFSDDYIYYKFTAADKYLKFSWDITKANHNKRITALNIYQSTSPDGTYLLASTINYLRRSENATKISGSDANIGDRFIYIPALSNVTFEDPMDYRITIKILTPQVKAIKNPGAGTHLVIELDDLATNLTGDLWNEDWLLEKDAGGWTSVLGGADGAYCGNKSIIVQDSSIDMAENSHVNELLIYFATTKIEEVITDNIGKAFKLTNGVASGDYGVSWKVVPIGYSYETTDNNNGTVTYNYYWRNYAGSLAHYLASAVSVKVNGRFAVICKEILFQFNVVLDPGGKNEVHEDWLMHSELSKYDVNPVSNAWYLIDREGGAGTGLGISFNSIIAMKEKAVFKLSIVDPSDSSTWILTEAKFQRGNVAPNGYVQVGDSIYMCSQDGIYRIDANIVAASDDTPLLANLISNPINDLYQGLSDISEKPFIVGIYDHIRTEIIWQFYEGCVWAYNIVEDTWREIDTDVAFDAVSIDEKANPMILDDGNKQIYSTAIPDNAGVALRTKWFRVSSDRKEVVREMIVVYESATALTVNLYVDGDDTTAVKTKTLAISATKTRKRVNFSYRCESYMIEIVDTAQGTGATKFYKFVIIDDGDN